MCSITCFDEKSVARKDPLLTWTSRGFKIPNNTAHCSIVKRGLPSCTVRRRAAHVIRYFFRISQYSSNLSGILTFVLLITGPTQLRSQCFDPDSIQTFDIWIFFEEDCAKSQLLLSIFHLPPSQEEFYHQADAHVSTASNQFIYPFTCLLEAEITP